MAKKNNPQQVQIVASEIGLRATALRSQITNAVAIRKVGNPKEFRVAMQAFDLAVEEFRRAII